MTRRRRGPGPTAYFYIVPALLFFGCFVVLPGLHTLYLSFFQWNGLTPATWVGFNNFVSLVSNPLLLGALRNALILLFFFTVLPIVLALVMTAIIGPRPRRGLTVFRAIYFVPQVAPLVAIGIVWRWMYNAGGPIDSLVSAVGLTPPREGWLGNFTTALPAIGLVGTWALYGICLTLFLTGVQKIDHSLYDAVRVDGGGGFWQFRAVTLPSLRREIALAASITGIAALSSFDLIYIATRGGPGDSTVVPGLLVYRLGFTDGNIGAASALAIGLMAITGLYVFLINRIDSGANES